MFIEGTRFSAAPAPGLDDRPHDQQCNDAPSCALAVTAPRTQATGTTNA